MAQPTGRNQAQNKHDLAAPFSQIFQDRAEAELAFDLLLETVKRLGLHSPYDERFALTLPRLSGKLALHLNFGRWLVLGFRGPGQSTHRVEMALLAKRVRWNERLNSLPFTRKEGEPEVRSYQLPFELIRPLTSNLHAAYNATLDFIADKFHTWKRTPYWKQHNPEIVEALFDADRRERLFAGGFDGELKYERHLTAFYQDVSEEVELYEVESDIIGEDRVIDQPSASGDIAIAQDHLQRRSNVDLNQKRLEFRKLFEEFLDSYPITPDGQRHISAYNEIREQGRQNFRMVVSIADKGEDVTELVLLKLLPYTDTATNRERGAWIHLAPTIRGDIRGWFENSGWTKPEDWPQIAEALLNFIRRCNDHPEQLEAACKEFSDLPYSKGFQTGMLTPILNALRPDDFILINNKSRRAFNYFSDTSYGQKLTDYPEINAVAHKLIAAFADEMHQFERPKLRDDDLFDMFSHWLVAVRDYHFGDREDVADTTSPLREISAEYDQSLPVGESNRIFSGKTFELLSDLHENPTKDFYMAHKEEFKTYVEEPFQQLFQEVASRLPPQITDVMETEKRTFARFLKNDFGQGGAWDFYWGAFYPKGGKRTNDAQLSMWINYERFEFGFYIGDYGSEVRKRFLRNCQENYSVLRKLLGDVLSDEKVLYGGHEDFTVAPDGSIVSKINLDWEEWLRDPDKGNFDVSVILTRRDVLRYSAEELTEQIGRTFINFFPLILLAINDEPLPVISEYLGLSVDDEDEFEINPEYPLPQLAEESGFDEAELTRWVRAIERKKQAILYGPPGTGKTFIAEKLAGHLIGGGDGFRDLVQFHPAYAYEDFIQGIRPESKGGELSYPLVKGRFLEFCEEARRRQGRCVLIIDEINRANLARVFGELMYLLEYRNREIPLAGGGTLKIPANVRLIGTMNTADRSIALVDHALRRRFAFLALYPNYEILRRFHQRGQTGFPVDGLIDILKRLNERIDDKHYAIGITFFLYDRLEEQIEDIWRMEIEPYLEEYFFDRRETVDDFRWDKIASEVLP